MDENIYGDDGLITKDTNEPEVVAETIKFRKPNHFRRKKALLMVLLVILACALLAGLVFGAYKLFFGRGKEKAYDYGSAFYFASDLLSEKGKDYSVNGVIRFEIRNYADELRVSKEKIENFEITLKCDGKDITENAKVSTGERSMDSGMKSNCKVEITLPEKYYGQKVEVSCKSKPIAVVLKGTFTISAAYNYSVAEPDDEGYSVTENGVYVEISLTAEEDTTFNVEINTKKLYVLPTDDEQDYIGRYKTDDGKYTIPVAAGSETVIHLLKADTNQSFDDSSKAIKVTKSDKYIKPNDNLIVKEKEEKND